MASPLRWLLLLLPVTVTGRPRGTEAHLREILERGVQAEVFPGAVAAAGGLDGADVELAVGHFTYSRESPTMSPSTVFDMASLTKVIATTSAVAVLYERGVLALGTRVVDVLGAEFASADASKADITVDHCLTHTAGYQPDPQPWYWEEAFGCPSWHRSSGDPPAEGFECLPRIYSSFLAEELVTTPGSQFAYSDLSFITLQFIVGRLAWERGLVTSEDLLPRCHGAEAMPLPSCWSCAFEAFVRLHVLSSVMPDSQFLLDSSRWPDAAPTLNDTVYTLRQPLQGQVSDGDAFAMGGVAGHAGLFSRLHDVERFAQAALQTLSGSTTATDSFPVNSTTLRLFTSVRDPAFSSRALGWDTNLRGVPDSGFDGVCGREGGFSSSTFLHIGYTGTCLCIDPERLQWSAILTNRVFGCQGQLCPADSEDAVKQVYRDFNTALHSSL